MPQIALVTDEHDDDVGIGMVPELLQPPRDVLVGGLLADVVNEQSTDSAAIVGRGDGTVALLAGSVPDLVAGQRLCASFLLLRLRSHLRLDGLGVNLDGPSGELNANRGL